MVDMKQQSQKKYIKNKIIRYQDIKTQKVLCANDTVSMR